MIGESYQTHLLPGVPIRRFSLLLQPPAMKRLSSGQFSSFAGRLAACLLPKCGLAFGQFYSFAAVLTTCLPTLPDEFFRQCGLFCPISPKDYLFIAVGLQAYGMMIASRIQSERLPILCDRFCVYYSQRWLKSLGRVGR